MEDASIKVRVCQRQAGMKNVLLAQLETQASTMVRVISMCSARCLAVVERSIKSLFLFPIPFRQRRLSTIIMIADKNKVDISCRCYCCITSGRDSTQIEISALSTLRPKIRQRWFQGWGEKWYTYALVALSIPIFSTTSSVLRRPAVSAITTGKPPISRDNSRMSRVVPGMGVTIAASRWATARKSDVNHSGYEKTDEKPDIPKKFNKLLFPALGGPNMASLMPERKSSPRRWSFKYPWIVCKTF